ncbi:hypothetical protein OAG04_00665 [bacterium]|nr:hypothetical protein [bacterium]
MAESSGTYHMQYLPVDTSNFVFLTQPFMPRVEATGADEDPLQVTFNQGYIFDYAAGGRRIEIGPLTHEIPAVGNQTFSIEMTLDHFAGNVTSAEIADNAPFSTISNLLAKSEIETTTSTDPARISLELCKFEDGQLSELFVRENIHMHMRGHRQLFDEFLDESGNDAVGHAVMKSEDSSFNNGFIDYRALALDPRSGNKLEITTSGNNILFFVSGSSEGSGE